MKWQWAILMQFQFPQTPAENTLELQIAQLTKHRSVNWQQLLIAKVAQMKVA